LQRVATPRRVEAASGLSAGNGVRPSEKGDWTPWRSS
jgi:hypothetical protein